MEEEPLSIEKLIEQEREHSFKVLKNKAKQYGADFIEDVFCDARLKALKSKNSYDPSRPFRKWWSRILHNALIDKINKNSNEISFDTIHEQEYNSFDLLNAQFELTDILHALEGLNDAQRNALMSMIDEETGVTIKKNKTPADRVVLHKARKRLLELLKSSDSD